MHTTVTTNYYVICIQLHHTATTYRKGLTTQLQSHPENHSVNGLHKLFWDCHNTLGSVSMHAYMQQP